MTLTITDKIIQEDNEKWFVDYDSLNFHWSWLSDTDLKKLTKAWILKFKTTNADIISDEKIFSHINCGSIDVTLWDTLCVYKWAKWIIDPKDPESYELEEIKIWEDGYILQPGEFYLWVTNEFIGLPDYIIGHICNKSSIGRMWLIIETAGLIDNSFEWTITLEIVNTNKLPVKVYKWQKIGQIYLFYMSSDSSTPYRLKSDSKYQGQIAPTVSKTFLDPDFKK